MVRNLKQIDEGNKTEKIFKNLFLVSIFTSVGDMFWTIATTTTAIKKKAVNNNILVVHFTLVHLTALLVWKI